MTLPTGIISFGNLRSEYKNTNSGSISMNELYYGGPYLQKNTCTDTVKTYGGPGYSLHFQNIPTSGQNNISNYKGKAYYYARQSNAETNGYDVSFNASSIEAESPKQNPENSAYFVLNTNGNCTATATNQYGLRIQAGNAQYTTCYFINYLYIYGKGGYGGRGQDGGYNGEDGGPALYHGTYAYIVNNGRILGGGGGGGGGGSQRRSYNECYCCNDTNYAQAGSGGGGGAGGGPGGPAGSSPGANFTYGGGTGGDGNYNDSSAGGNGGSNAIYNGGLGTRYSAVGGNGGDWGQKGGDGQSPDDQVSGPTGGGNGGAGIVHGNGYKILTTGTIAGSY